MQHFTHQYQSMTTIDFTNLPYWDLCAALRSASQIAEWGLDDTTKKSMRERSQMVCHPGIRKTSGSMKEKDRSLPLTYVDNFGYILCMQMKLELVAVPVTDVDRAKAFYTEKIGFNADHDYQVRDDLRFVQLTPPGSACSIVIGVGITDMPPGSQKGLQMVVADVKEVRDELAKRGVEVSEIEVMPWGSFVFFSDPDGNRWSLQQLPVRP